MRSSPRGASPGAAARMLAIDSRTVGWETAQPRCPVDHELKELPMSESLFTSESVTEGHPDKLCDQVSDGILDALIKDDKGSRVACETLTKTGFVMVAGEGTSSAQIDIRSEERRGGEGGRS